MSMEFVERKRWLFLGLPFTFTKYTVKEDMVTIQSGFFKTIENDCYMYKIQDVELSARLIEKCFGLATITCFTGDTTHPKPAYAAFCKSVSKDADNNLHRVDRKQSGNHNIYYDLSDGQDPYVL